MWHCRGVLGCAHARSASLAFLCFGGRPCSSPRLCSSVRVARRNGCFEAATGHGNQVPGAIGFSGGAAAGERSLREMELASHELFPRRPETLHFPICSVLSHTMAMGRHLGVGHPRLHTWET